ncbi:hypothetical protein NAL32_20850 [Chryseobacterium sp. Ch-15]|uniref:SnoaL-like domain-containing protein n=1 Tax=Chryseobacterium muglaense TaxID=2893752 RepID=A0A9Q3URK9_9FLAO|nr:hypothetical protein [Chryseobacterium muglaense]MBD3904402.1 hypothetical protein [Chryseobacterium muglaense]MCC9032763.1 hypothetical protein [Chryseobacterium muglaense]MCM2556841.1 hypothetical protein [Chryseobacterium muglaense]
MKKLIPFLLIILSGLISAQNIEPVRKAVQQINQTKDFKIKTVPYSYFMDKSEVTDNGIELKGFYKNGKLRKMNHWVGLSAWKIITEYFFSENNRLIFVHSTKYQTVDENGYLEKPQKLSEIRCYYENDKLIKSVGTFNTYEKTDYLKESKNLINDLKNYNN